MNWSRGVHAELNFINVLLVVPEKTALHKLSLFSVLPKIKISVLTFG